MANSQTSTQAYSEHSEHVSEAECSILHVRLSSKYASYKNAIKSHKNVFMKCVVPGKTILVKDQQSLYFFVTFVIWRRSATSSILTSIRFHTPTHHSFMQIFSCRYVDMLCRYAFGKLLQVFSSEAALWYTR